MGTPELPPLEQYKPYRKLIGDARTELGSALRVHYDNGASLENLAEQIDSTRGTIRRLLVASGATIRNRGHHDRHPN
jgi:helix-turn-helix protein